MPNARAGLSARLVLLFVAALHWPFSAAAAPREWVRIQSPHFELFTTAGEGRGRDALIYFERIRNFFIAATNSKPSGERVTIIAFGSAKEFGPYRPNDFSVAYYRPGHDREYIVMGQISDDARAVAAHEYVHLLIKHSGIEMPLWLNEGLAEFYSTLAPVGKQVRVGAVPVNRLLYLRQKKLLSLEELTTADHGSPHYNEKNRAGVFYSQSWALAHMISLSDGYRDGSKQFVLELANGVPAADAFQKVYGKSLDAVQKDLSFYIHGEAFKAVIFNIELEKPDDVAVTPAGGLETGLLLGDLLSFGPSVDQARQKYEETMQAYPEAPAVREALGYLALRDNNREEAKQFFADAVRLNATNGKLYYDYALLLREGGAANGEVIPLLERAVQLNDDLQESRLYLGYLLMDEKEFEKALLVFARLKRVRREQAVRLYRAQAYAFYRTGEKDEAEKAIEIAKKHAETPSEIDSVAKLEELLRWQENGGREPAAAYEAAGDTSGAAAGPPSLTRAADSKEPAETVGAPPEPEEALSTVTVEGTLETFECVGVKARMKVAVDGNVKAFAINDPGEIVVMGADAGLFEFTCGPQNSRPLSIEYEPKADADFGTVGEVRIIYLE